VLQIPLIEYHDRNWRWLDLALAIKQRCKRVLLQQFMRHKLLKSRLGHALGSSATRLDLMNLPEEAKARMLLGAKLMVRALRDFSGQSKIPVHRARPRRQSRARPCCGPITEPAHAYVALTLLPSSQCGTLRRLNSTLVICHIESCFVLNSFNFQSLFTLLAFLWVV